MSIHRSLKSSGLKRTRSVLRRVERLAILKDQERWDESKSVYGLPKVRTKFKVVRKKKKEEKTETPEEQPAEEKKPDRKAEKKADKKKT
ncbi:MAG: small basic protein [Planctomycetota bacterium]